jgi:hypothetical protein
VKKEENNFLGNLLASFRGKDEGAKPGANRDAGSDDVSLMYVEA